MMHLEDLRNLKSRKRFLEALLKHFTETAARAYPSSYHPKLVEEYAKNDAYSEFARLGFDKEVDRINAEIKFIEHLNK